VHFHSAKLQNERAAFSKEQSFPDITAYFLSIANNYINSSRVGHNYRTVSKKSMLKQN